MVFLSVYVLHILMAPVPPTLLLPIVITLPVPQRVCVRFPILTALLQHQLVLELSASAITDSLEINAQPQSILPNARVPLLLVLRGRVLHLENAFVLLEKLVLIAPKLPPFALTLLLSPVLMQMDLHLTSLQY